MPSSVIARECMDLVDDDRAHRAEEEKAVRPPRDQQRFQAFRRGQEDVWWLSKRPRLRGLSDVSMPKTAGPADESRIEREPKFQVIQQRTNRAYVENRQPAPILG